MVKESQEQLEEQERLKAEREKRVKENINKTN
jgi:hypothetical protein